MIDYSQYGQALVLQQLITPDTPRCVVDIGTHDGIIGSNSRRLLELGWAGVLVEPLPNVFARLQMNSSDFNNSKLLRAAVSDAAGVARMRIGRDGHDGQLSSLSDDEEILPNVSDETLDVETVTLRDVLEFGEVPDDFGILLLDTEGLDVIVLRGLAETLARPRIIMTEDFKPTIAPKYDLLRSFGYKHAGECGFDSLWVHSTHTADLSALVFPVNRLPSGWEPNGVSLGPGRVAYDRDASLGTGAQPLPVAGWAWDEQQADPAPDVIITLSAVSGGDKHAFAAWRTPRPDVAQVFASQRLLMSGFRAFVDVAPGTYNLTVVQQDTRGFTSTPAGIVSLP